MTRRERMERRLGKRQEWAASRDRSAERRFDAAHKIAHNIPFGQPVLVGHHSERHHRRDLARIDSNMSRGVEDHKMAQHHRGAAIELERSLERSIFDDDPDAIEQLEERIAAREARRAHGKKVNAAWRKAGKPDPLDADTWAPFAEKVGAEDARFAESGLRYQRQGDSTGLYSWAKPYDPKYDGANIRRDQQRIASIRQRQQRTAAAEEAGGVTVEHLKTPDWSPVKYCRVTFAEKPERSTIDALKAAGYCWGRGSWTGDAAMLPECVAAEVL
jgi:hypothetical protein